MRATINVKGLPANATVKDAINALRRLSPDAALALAPGEIVKVKGVAIKVHAPQISDVRTWAKSQGIEVGQRGRVSAEVQAAYDAAHAPKGRKRVSA